MKTGWIFRIKGKTGIYSSGYGMSEETIPTTKRLKDAVVVSNRHLARFVKADHETILQVLLSKAGRPIKILSRG
jgi:hypothetical protein